MGDPSNPDHLRAVSSAQDSQHAAEFDYDAGSPHLRHAALRTMVEGRLTKLVTSSIQRSGSCRVLEIGAGHGTFTRCLVDAGAAVTVTETSSASAQRLKRTFGDSVDVRLEVTGEEVLDESARWDVAVMTSVVHHIPDYLSFLRRLSDLVAGGGTLFTVQDPLYYPRMQRLTHRADRAAYYAWRLRQGNVKRGAATALRRARGVHDDKEPSDLVEYHVVRDGVDEEAISALLSPLYQEVEVFRYWSSQGSLMQRLGRMASIENTFGVEATVRLLDSDAEHTSPTIAE